MTTTQKLTLRQIQALAEQGKKLSITTPFGNQPISKVFLNGRKMVFLFNGVLPITADHELFLLDGTKVPAHQVKAGDMVQGEDGPIKIESIDPVGVRDVGDIQVGHESHRYFSHGFVVSNCGSCFDVERTHINIRRSPHGPVQNVLLGAIPALMEKGIVYSETDTGYHPISKYHDNGTKRTYHMKVAFAEGDSIPEILSIFVTEDHIFYTKDMRKVAARDLEAGQALACQAGLTAWVEGFYPGTSCKVADLEINHPDHRYIVHGVVVSNCTTTQEVAHLSSKTKPIERGNDWVPKIEAIKRDDAIAQKLLVEVWQEGGPYSIMAPNWFRTAINRAILSAGKMLGWDLVESLIYEKHGNTRQLYRIKDEDFKSMVSGVSVFEVTFNALFVFTPEKVEKLLAEVNRFKTEGWKIRAIKLVSSDFNLRNNLQYALTTFRFDSRKVSHDTVNLPLLQSLIKKHPKRVTKYKQQVRVNKQVVRTKTIPFDNSKILALAAGMGRNSHETVLRVLGSVEDVHPLIWLAGFLSEGSNPKSYPAIYGTDVVVEAFLAKPQAQTQNIFNLLKDHEAATVCGKCGGARALNVISGLPFGEAENERDEILHYKYGPTCQSCFMQEAS